MMDNSPEIVGRFISVEGIEGVGKSTNLDFVADQLRQAGYDVIQTREPGGTPSGEDIRDILLNRPGKLPALTELLLMFAARAIHLDEVIRPALRSGQWIVCDRFTDASYAYQGGGRQLPWSTIDQLVAMVHPDLRPDLTLLLDAPLEVSNDRRSSRVGRDRFERESAAFFGRVREAYLQLAAREPERICVIDAARPLAAVQSDIRAAIRDFLRE